MSARPLAAAAALALLLAACSSGGPGGDGAICDGLAPWHEAQLAFLERTVDEETREGPRYVVTYDLYEAAAAVPLPEPAAADDEELLALIDSLHAAERDWVLALRVRNVANASTSGATEADRERSIAALETARTEMSDAIDRTNAALSDRCDLPVFPTYDPASG
jgi:hypothetical protein